MNIILNSWCQEDCTLGRLNYGVAFKCFTLELPWKDNLTNISCVPAGIYPYTKYDSPKHGLVLLLEDIPDRTFIEIHAGNYTRQILGCVLPGDGIKYLDNDSIPDVVNSRTTLRRLLAVVPERGHIDIRRCGLVGELNF